MNRFEKTFEIEKNPFRPHEFEKTHTIEKPYPMYSEDLIFEPHKISGEMISEAIAIPSEIENVKIKKTSKNKENVRKKTSNRKSNKLSSGKV